MNHARAVRAVSAQSRGPEVSLAREFDDFAERAADMATDLYARAERSRRRESLEELLSRGRES